MSLLLDQNQDAKCFVKSQFEKFSQLVKTALCTNVLSLSEQDAREYLHCGAKVRKIVFLDSQLFSILVSILLTIWNFCIFEL